MADIDFDELFQNDNCFCGSQISYVECHKKKIYKKQNEIPHDQAKFSRRNRACPIRVDGVVCGKNTISSHSQQRRGALKAITEKGHVAGFSNGPNTKPSLRGKIGLELISARKASTFPGLCAEHDKQLFKEIENKVLKPNFRTSLQLAKRCAYYEAVVHSDVALFSNWLTTVPKFQFPFDTECVSAEIDNMMHYSGYTWHLLEIISKIEQRSSARKLNYYSVLIDTVLPFSATGCFCIENDLLGKKLQPFSESNRKFSYAHFSVNPQSDGSTIFSISSTDDMDRKASFAFIDSFRNVNSTEFANALLRTALEHTENIYFRPSWIAALSETARQEIIGRFDDFVVFSVGSEKPAGSLVEPLGITIEGGKIKTSSNLGNSR